MLMYLAIFSRKLTSLKNSLPLYVVKLLRGQGSIISQSMKHLRRRCQSFLADKKTGNRCCRSCWLLLPAMHNSSMAPTQRLLSLYVHK